ncbi:class II aldolase/adducin family protein [Cyanobium sp. CH-040]|uniref:class II aldolase/adducin family protein n=1 Tax=Cyanobium sp. CH-040 TaxID=2823708 RepID=UPI0020CF044E|nr:class II aldolase/adducin family protein [Cyanobium sp. CH-040]MCP9927277.1 class II aldolase/adducin family protein [Cyanobium sp. CH-040]
MPLANDDPRRRLVASARRLQALGLNQGTAGNLSLRLPDGLLITPSSLPCDRMGPEDLVELDPQGRVRSAAPGRQPSSEWRLHADILRSRPEVQAVVHCHSIRATALACHGRGIPPFHYMVVQAGGADIRCAPYATFGGQALSDAALVALRDRRACLLAHHGQVTLGRDLDQALQLAVEVETLAHMYLEACRLGEPPVLDAAEMERVSTRMAELHYGAAGPAPG